MHLCMCRRILSRAVYDRTTGDDDDINRLNSIITYTQGIDIFCPRRQIDVIQQNIIYTLYRVIFLNIFY